jgi:hypothetical protein
MAKHPANTPTAEYQVRALPGAVLEARAFLDGAQYAAMAEMLRRLKDFHRPGGWTDLDVVEEDKFAYVQERGGIFDLINWRAYFRAYPAEGTIVVLHVRKQDVDTPTKLGTSTLVRINARGVTAPVSAALV